MDVYFTNLRLLEKRIDWTGLGIDVPDLPPSLSIPNLYLNDGTPFILSYDGAGPVYDLRLNRFLRSLPILGVHSHQTERAYALDLAHWARYLDRVHGKTVFQATREDVIAYKKYRLKVEKVAPATWNRALAALTKFYRWASESPHRYIEYVPFHFKDAGASAREWGRHQKNAAAEPESEKRVDPIRVEDYRIWRDIGIRDLGNPESRVRNADRNLFITDLLIGKGFRRSEAGLLLDREWPADAVRLTVPGVIRKNKRDLTLYVTPRLQRRLRDYLEYERPVAIERGKLLDPPFGIEYAICLVPPTDSGRVYFQGTNRWTTMDRLDEEERGRIVWAEKSGQVLGPGALLLTENGTPLLGDGIWSILREANTRCRKHDVNVTVKPHKLRHSFATNMLRFLVQRHLSEEERLRLSDVGVRAYAAAVWDPLRRLQLLMGHSSILSTYKYLDYIRDAQDMIEKALEDWDSEYDLRDSDEIDVKEDA